MCAGIYNHQVYCFILDQEREKCITFWKKIGMNLCILAFNLLKVVNFRDHMT